MRKNCPNTEFFLVRIFPHSDWIFIQSECGKIRTRKNSVSGHISRSDYINIILIEFDNTNLLGEISSNYNSNKNYNSKLLTKNVGCLLSGRISQSVFIWSKQQWKHQKGVWNLFNNNNKNTRATSIIRQQL